MKDFPKFQIAKGPGRKQLKFNALQKKNNATGLSALLR